ncbi:hypothetical protein ACFL7D_11830 [candidate division KSB1 bacterium]
MLKTTDGGSTWNKIKEVCSIRTLKYTDNTLWSLHSDPKTKNATLSKSTDEGKTWTDIPLGTSSSSDNPAAIAIHPDNPNNIYIVLLSLNADQEDRNKMSGKSRILKSTDGGKTVKTILEKPFTLDMNTITPESIPVNPMINNVVIDPSDKHIFYYSAGDGIFRSQNDGNKWTEVYDKQAMNLYVNTKGDVYASNGNEIICSKNNGESWNEIFKMSKTNEGSTIPIPNVIMNMKIDEKRNLLYYSTPAGLFSTKLK